MGPETRSFAVRKWTIKKRFCQSLIMKLALCMPQPQLN